MIKKLRINESNEGSLPVTSKEKFTIKQIFNDAGFDIEREYESTTMFNGDYYDTYYVIVDDIGDWTIEDLNRKFLQLLPSTYGMDFTFNKQNNTYVFSFWHVDFKSDYYDEDEYEDEDNIYGISSKEEAYQWLEDKLDEYGGYKYFPDKESFILNKLIDKYGNTYFWNK